MDHPQLQRDFLIEIRDQCKHPPLGAFFMLKSNVSTEQFDDDNSYWCKYNHIPSEFFNFLKKSSILLFWMYILYSMYRGQHKFLMILYNNMYLNRCHQHYLTLQKNKFDFVTPDGILGMANVVCRGRCVQGVGDQQQQRCYESFGR